LEKIVKPFERFFPGNHLILGEAGSGKTRLIWFLLQGKEYIEDNSINIVLTDSEKRIWSKPKNNPIVTLNPYDTDISWATNPHRPGIYYCACEYSPRIITFLECLATWAMHHENVANKTVRLFVDFSSKYWNLPEFVEQLIRLHYIVDGQHELNGSIEIWSVFGSLKKLPVKARPLFQKSNLVLLNPFPQEWSENISDLLSLKDEKAELIAQINKQQTEGYYYLPIQEDRLFLNPDPIKQIS